MAVDWPGSFFVLPDGSAIVRADVAPCRKCGRAMAFVSTDFGIKYQCPTCVRRKPEHRVLGTLDAGTWTIRTPTRDRA